MGPKRLAFQGLNRPPSHFMPCRRPSLNQAIWLCFLANFKLLINFLSIISFYSKVRTISLFPTVQCHCLFFRLFNVTVPFSDCSMSLSLFQTVQCHCPFFRLFNVTVPFQTVQCHYVTVPFQAGWRHEGKTSTRIGRNGIAAEGNRKRKRSSRGANKHGEAIKRSKSIKGMNHKSMPCG
jgi:hypothetical protein